MAEHFPDFQKKVDYISLDSVCLNKHVFYHPKDGIARNNGYDPADWAIRISDVMDVPAADVVEVVRCKDCIHAPLPGDCEGNDLEWPKVDGIYEDCTCPHCCGDRWYSTRPDPDGFCEKGKRRADNG